ncbi:MAG TPA: DJ-1/PfpI family protein [Jatrophihabitantaceae bacterium]|nr:DJ-1/PfpI family protein [Jatrophihabitantaceae bacterium]
MSDASPSPGRIAIALFPDVEELDFAGPWEVLSYWAREVAPPGWDVVTVAATTDPIRAAKGLRVVPDHTLHDVGPLAVFLMPGGIGTRKQLDPDEPLHVALRAMQSAGTLLTSVCTGALVYAAAGLLRDRPATTHWQALELLSSIDPTIDVRPDARYVDDGDVITAAGVSAGIDMALHLVQRLDSTDAAKQVKAEIQYDPQPPV